MDTPPVLLLLALANVLQWTEASKDENSTEKSAERTVFQCEVLPPSPSVPTSVHDLRPGDIRVVAALGDSMTAGTGVEAHTIAQELTPNRGLSWSGGGQGTLKQHLTLPNILKQYSPQLYGYATGDGTEDSAHAHFNLAVVGADSSGLVGQARQLVQRMRGDGGVDFVRDWKLVTILIGNNDLCRYCSHPKVYTEAQFYQNLVRGLDVLHAELPRTLVSLVEPVNMDTLSRLHGSPLCAGVHHMVCGCASFPQSPGAAHRLAQLTAQLQRTVQSLARSGRYDTRRDFTVVHQPCLSHITLPTQEDGSPDPSYFAPDCFHLSAKGQEAAALALWNNMVSPVEGKDTDWTPGQSFNCPSQEQPYLYTVVNSRRPSPLPPHAVSVQLLTALTITGLVLIVVAYLVFIAACRRLQWGGQYVQVPH